MKPKPDIVLVSVESARFDFVDELSPPPGFNVHGGVAAAHYTRPSLAALLSGQYRAAVETNAVTPTLASVLASDGYSTMGVSYSPQTIPAFSFDHGFDEFEYQDASSEPGLARGSSRRERFAENRVVRAVHRRLNPKSATLERVPPDSEAVDWGIERVEAAEKPFFCWIHLMESHRPYGRGESALPDRVDRRAAACGPGAAQRTLSDTDHELVVQHYREGLRRAGEHLRRLVKALSSSTRVVVVGDHGEELGEEEFYYHGGYRRRLVDSIVRVPVLTRNIEVEKEPISLTDIAPVICHEAGVRPPDSWDGPTSPHCLSVARWHDQASVRWISPGGGFTVQDGYLEAIAETDMVAFDGVRKQLSALGYRV